MTRSGVEDCYFYIIASNREIRESKYKIGVTNDILRRLNEYNGTECSPGDENVRKIIWVKYISQCTRDIRKYIDDNIKSDFDQYRVIQDGTKLEWVSISAEKLVIIFNNFFIRDDIIQCHPVDYIECNTKLLNIYNPYLIDQLKTGHYIQPRNGCSLL